MNCSRQNSLWKHQMVSCFFWREPQHFERNSCVLLPPFFTANEDSGSICRSIILSQQAQQRGEAWQSLASPERIEKLRHASRGTQSPWIRFWFQEKPESIPPVSRPCGRGSWDKNQALVPLRAPKGFVALPGGPRPPGYDSGSRRNQNRYPRFRAPVGAGRGIKIRRMS